MLKKHSGFTLIELLAVIVILGIILLVTFPIITDIIESSRRAAFETYARTIVRSVDYKLVTDDPFDTSQVAENNIMDFVRTYPSNYRKINFKVEDNVAASDDHSSDDTSGLKYLWNTRKLLIVHRLHLPLTKIVPQCNFVPEIMQKIKYLKYYKLCGFCFLCIKMSIIDKII